MRLIMTTVLILIAGFISPVLAQEWDELRFSDTDDDGINDLFRDADGDGINDITGMRYRHRFTFTDTDGDGINDLFRDADGDGINDLADDSGKLPEGGVDFYVIDYDGDGVNDVTGKKYVRKLSIRSFIDENGDGIDDRESLAPVRSLLDKIIGDDTSGKRVVLESLDGPTMDRFIDENRDGINDGRSFTKNLTPESLNNAP